VSIVEFFHAAFCEVYHSIITCKEGKVHTQFSH